MTGDPPGYVVAFDFGLRHIGVAIGQTVTGTARGIGTLRARHGRPDWATLAGLLDEYGPARAVVGLPLNMDGSESELSGAARRFAAQLTEHTGLPCSMHDERLTTRAAKAELAEAKKSGVAATEHELAACLILRSALGA